MFWLLAIELCTLVIHQLVTLCAGTMAYLLHLWIQKMMLFWKVLHETLSSMIDILEVF